MPDGLKPFVDHYAVLECSPSNTPEQLKKAYHEKLRQFHPDKRPWSAGDYGQQVTQSLNEAWEALRFPALREAYDVIWHREKTPAPAPAPPQPPPPPDREVREPQPRGRSRRRHDEHDAPAEASDTEAMQRKADELKGEGNQLYRNAQAAMATVRSSEAADSLEVRMTAMQQYRLAIRKYSDAIQLTPQNHRLWSNRALCHAALKQWDQCREDGLRSTQLKSDFSKGWFLVAKAMWKEGSRSAALKQIEVALRLVSQPEDLLALKDNILREVEEKATSRSSSKTPGLHLLQMRSRSVSPCITPTPGSRVATPPPVSPVRTPSRRSQAAAEPSSGRAPSTSSRKRSTSRTGKLPAMPAHVARAFAVFGEED